MHEGYALLTGPGPAAIAVIDLYGPVIGSILKRHLRVRKSARGECRESTEGKWVAGQVLRAELLDEDGEPIDDILLTTHHPPPDWHLRLHLHGNPVIVARCRTLLEQHGIHELPAGGDWQTLLWPDHDVLAAEAYALLPRMLTLRGARWLLEQVERLRLAIQELQCFPAGEQVRQVCREIAARASVAEWFSRPLRVAFVGPPNVGKSTLVNALADRPVCIVSPVPGTTRDWVEVPGEVQGFPVTWLDTAGLRQADDALEAAGMEQTCRLMREADAIVAVLDLTGAAKSVCEFVRHHREQRVAAVALNKCDLGGSPVEILKLLPVEWRGTAVQVSALQRVGLEELCRRMLDGVGRSEAALELPAAFTSRQLALLLSNEADDPKVLKDMLLHWVPPG